MKENAKVLLLLFIFGIIVVIPVIAGWISFQSPQKISMTATAIYLTSHTTLSVTSQLTQTLAPQKSLTATSSQTPIPATTTPYTVKYPGFLHCRKSPSFTSEELFLIRGHQFTILAQNQDRDWLYVNVEKQYCWIYSDIPYLELTPNQITRVPTIVIVLTLPLP